MGIIDAKSIYRHDIRHTALNLLSGDIDRVESKRQHLLEDHIEKLMQHGPVPVSTSQRISKQTQNSLRRRSHEIPRVLFDLHNT